MTMTEASERRRLEERAEAIEAELESRKSASEKAADRFLNPPERGADARGTGWQEFKATAVSD